MGSQIAQISPSTQPQGKGSGSTIAQLVANKQPSFVNEPDMRHQVGVLDQKPMAVNDIYQLGDSFGDVDRSRPQQTFNQALGKGSRVTYPGQGGQPKMGVPNNYSNTVGQWDNASIQPRQTQSGKGKGY